MTTPLTGNQVQPSEGLRRLSPFYWFGNLRLAVKLPMIIVVLGGLVAVVLTATSYFDSRAIMLDEIKSKFYSTLESLAVAREGAQGGQAGVGVPPAPL